MGILDEIVANKRREVIAARNARPIVDLEKSPHFSRPIISLKDALTRQGSSGVIAEIKRKSPSKGELNMGISVPHLSTAYAHAGAAALSILTDVRFFAGSNKDVSDAREVNQCPILRKEFIIDEYQLVEARAIGADVVLLIARILSATELKRLAQVAANLGLEVLCEVHEESELEKSMLDEIAHIGINSRNLDTLEIDINSFKRIGELIPSSKIRVAESGISRPETVRELKTLGFSGFLIGENFMKTTDPGRACREFIQQATSITGV